MDADGSAKMIPMSSAAATKQDIEELRIATKQDSEELRKDILDVLQDFMERVDERFNKVEREIVDLKESHNRLLNTVDGFISRIDRYETELAARDSQFEKLLVWARKVSEKTGVPLENL